MRKALLLTAVLLLCAAWVMAQTPQSTPPANSPAADSAPSAQTSPSTSDQMGSPSSQTSQTPSGMSKAGSETQIEGCLSGSSGNFTLTDASGTAWQLQGDNSQLNKHVGQEVRVSGMASASSAPGTTSGSSASSAGAAGQSFNVIKVHKVANTCSQAGSATPSK